MPVVVFVSAPLPASTALIVPLCKVIVAAVTAPAPLIVPAFVSAFSVEADDTLHALVESTVRLSVPTAALLMKPVSVVLFCSVVVIVL